MTGHLLFNSLYNIPSPNSRPYPRKREIEHRKMKIPSRRKLAAIALIVAGIVAVGVPFFLMHSASPQGTSPSPTTTSGNNNGGSSSSTTSNLHGGTPGSTTCTQDCSTTGSGSDSNSGSGSGSGGSGGNSCSDSKSHGSGSGDESSDVKAGGKDNDNGKQNGNAFRVLKNQLDTTIALAKSMGVHNSAFHQQHDTKTDNHTIHDPEGAAHDSDNDDQPCTSTADANEQD